MGTELRPVVTAAVQRLRKSPGQRTEPSAGLSTLLLSRCGALQALRLTQYAEGQAFRRFPSHRKVREAFDWSLRMLCPDMCLVRSMVDSRSPGLAKGRQIRYLLPGKKKVAGESPTTLRRIHFPKRRRFLLPASDFRPLAGWLQPPSAPVRKRSS